MNRTVCWTCQQRVVLLGVESWGERLARHLANGSFCPRTRNEVGSERMTKRETFASSHPESMSAWQRRAEYLVGRTKELIDVFDHTMLQAQETWPKGANGPIAVAAYEALADRSRELIFMLRAMLARESYTLTNPEGSE